MICVEIGVDGAVYAVTPQPADVSACGMVIVSADSVMNTPWALTPEQGSQIGASILLVWAVALTFRLIGRALSTVDSEEKTT